VNDMTNQEPQATGKGEYRSDYAVVKWMARYDALAEFLRAAGYDVQRLNGDQGMLTAIDDALASAGSTPVLP
jgi:hypothetical protein